MEKEFSEYLKKILANRKEEANGILRMDEEGVNIVEIFGKIISKAKP